MADPENADQDGTPTPANAPPAEDELHRRSNRNHPPEPAETISARAALRVIGAFGFVLVASLVAIAASSHAHYSQGINAAIDAGENVDQATVLARRVFLLASGHQIMLFKAIAYGMAIMLALSGIVLVLNGAKAAYELSSEDEGLGVRHALTTTSPGLVVITLAVALAAGTLASKSSLQDHLDWDLQGQTQAAADQASTDEQQRIDQLRSEQKRRVGGEVDPPPAPEGETEDEKLQRIKADQQAREEAKNAQ